MGSSWPRDSPARVGGSVDKAVRRAPLTAARPENPRRRTREPRGARGGNRLRNTESAARRTERGRRIGGIRPRRHRAGIAVERMRWTKTDRGWRDAMHSGSVAFDHKLPQAAKRNAEANIMDSSWPRDPPARVGGSVDKAVRRAAVNRCARPEYPRRRTREPRVAHGGESATDHRIGREASWTERGRRIGACAPLRHRAGIAVERMRRPTSTGRGGTRSIPDREPSIPRARR